MTPTQSQIRDALNTLDHWRECRSNFGTTQNRTEYDQAALDVCTGHAETIRTILQSALDTQKPAGDAGDFSVLYEIKDSLPNPSQVRDKLNIWLYHNDPKLPHNKG